MNLWIRSQDGKQLMICNEVLCDSGIICVNNTYVAEYETEERALEVLDEIQKLLTQGEVLVWQNSPTDDIEFKNIILKNLKEVPMICTHEKDEKVDYIHRDCIVYEMPKE